MSTKETDQTASGSPRTPPEAELEAMLSAALAKAFPSVPRSDFHHQTRFSVTVGRQLSRKRFSGDIVKKHQFTGTEVEQLVEVAKLWMDAPALFVSPPTSTARAFRPFKRQGGWIEFANFRQGVVG